MRCSIFILFCNESINMNRLRRLSIIATLLFLTGICKAEQEKNNIWNKDSLTDGLFGLNDSLSKKGIELNISSTQIYQQNLRGGSSTHRKAGRFSGSYDVEITTDLQKLLGFETGTLFLHLEGGWPNTEGIDGVSVGSAFGVNADAIGNEAMLVKQLFYEGLVFGDDITLMIGKIDFTGIFDATAYADDECTQFMNAAFVDNPTIPFPGYSLGAVLKWNVTDNLYVTGGIADAQADARETGFNTTFDGDNYFFYIFEAGITPLLSSANGPLQGTYRAGLWYDPQPKANSDYADAGKNYRDDVGFYISCDQMLVKENTKPEDNQGLGSFFRFGYAESKKNDLANFWSVGFQYQGLLEGRDDDVVGVGFAQGIFSDKASLTYTEDYESALELYYNAQVTQWLNISPSVQYIANPGGDKTGSDAVVLGVRAKVTF